MPRVPKNQVSPAISAWLGKISGKEKGGIARAKALTPEQRSAIGKKASEARWAGRVAAERVPTFRDLATTPFGRFLVLAFAAAVELHRETMISLTKDALGERKAQRRPYSPTPYGFDRRDGQLVEQPSEIAVVRRARQLREEGKTLRAIAEILNNASVPTKNGKAWHASTVGKILTNTIHDSKAA